MGKKNLSKTDWEKCLPTDEQNYGWFMLLGF